MARQTIDKLHHSLVKLRFATQFEQAVTLQQLLEAWQQRRT
jgi:hypothetical protein